MVVQFDMSRVRHHHAPREHDAEVVLYDEFTAAKHKRSQRIERNRRFRPER